MSEMFLFSMKETRAPLERHIEERLSSLPGYGTLPLVTSSVSSIPKDHTSDLIVKRPYKAASGAVHLIGNLAPGKKGIESEEQEEQASK